MGLAQGCMRCIWVRSITETELQGESQFTTEKLTAYELTAHFTLFKIILSFDLQFNQSIKCLL